MRCVPCDNNFELGWWGPGYETKTHCRVCHRTWPVATKEVHCLSCHESFTNITISDWHDRTGACLPPSDISRKDGTPVYGSQVRSGRQLWGGARSESHPFAEGEAS